MNKTVHILKKPLTMTLIAIFFGFLVAGIILAACRVLQAKDDCRIL